MVNDKVVHNTIYKSTYSIIVCGQPQSYAIVLFTHPTKIFIPELSNTGAVAGEAVFAFFAGGPSAIVTRLSAIVVTDSKMPEKRPTNHPWKTWHENTMTLWSSCSTRSNGYHTVSRVHYYMNDAGQPEYCTSYENTLTAAFWNTHTHSEPFTNQIKRVPVAERNYGFNHTVQGYRHTGNTTYHNINFSVRQQAIYSYHFIVPNC